MFIVGGASNLIGVIGFLIEAAIAVLIIVFLIKGIKHFNCKEERDVRQDCQRAQDTIDEIERELNDRKKD